MILDAGQHERTKAAVHGAVGALAATCLIYNACAMVKRPAFHLFANSLFYAFLTAVEVSHVAHHLGPRE